MRLFFALWPDDATRGALAARLRTLHGLCGGRPTRPEAVHLTLAFLGDTDAARLEALLAAAASVPLRPFILTLDQAGFWTHNKIAWVGATRSPPELDDLVTALRRTLAENAFPFDPKPFVAHITLVRKGRPGFQLPAFAPLQWPVREFVLVRSVPTAAGSDYSICGRWG